MSSDADRLATYEEMYDQLLQNIQSDSYLQDIHASDVAFLKQKISQLRDQIYGTPE